MSRGSPSRPQCQGGPTELLTPASFRALFKKTGSRSPQGSFRSRFPASRGTQADRPGVRAAPRPPGRANGEATEILTQPASGRHGTCWAPLAQRSALGRRAVLPASQRESCACFWVLPAPLPKPQWHCPWARVPRASASSARLQRPHPDRHSCRGCVSSLLPIPPVLTLCGARSSRWTPANWVPRARSSRNVNSGGRLGSGKLVLLKGSVSSKNCTRQASVAMMHPCPVGRGPQGQRAAQAGAPGLCGGEAAATAAASRLAGSQATARPAAARTPATGGGAGAGLAPSSSRSRPGSSPARFTGHRTGLPRPSRPLQGQGMRESFAQRR